MSANDENTPPRKRRVRYKGTHPRSFKEKYKEQASDPALVEKLINKGKTPAGTHRPIMVAEILKRLAPRPGEIGVDATLGFGGHTFELLQKLRPNESAPTEGRLIAFDRDPIESAKTTERLSLKGFSDETLTVINTDYANIEAELTRLGLKGKIAFLLADLGLSSMQIDNPDRGFTFKREGPLDLRMNPTVGIPAHEVLKRATESELARWLEEYSDEPRARHLARAITERQNRTPILTTRDLADTIRAWMKNLGPNVRAKEGDLPLKRTFQALRIQTNHEFESLEKFLESLPRILAPNGRVAILSFHSGEDRRVKKAFQKLNREGVFSEVSDEAERPTVEEQKLNTRSKPAKLRWAIKTSHP